MHFSSDTETLLTADKAEKTNTKLINGDHNWSWSTSLAAGIQNRRSSGIHPHIQLGWWLLQNPISVFGLDKCPPSFLPNTNFLIITFTTPLNSFSLIYVHPRRNIHLSTWCHRPTKGVKRSEREATGFWNPRAPAKIGQPWAYRRHVGG